MSLVSNFTRKQWILSVKERLNMNSLTGSTAIFNNF